MGRRAERTARRVQCRSPDKPGRGRFRQRRELNCRRHAACAWDDAADGAGYEAGELRRAIPKAAADRGGVRVRQTATKFELIINLASVLFGSAGGLQLRCAFAMEVVCVPGAGRSVGAAMAAPRRDGCDGGIASSTASA